MVVKAKLGECFVGDGGFELAPDDELALRLGEEGESFLRFDIGVEIVIDGGVGFEPLGFGKGGEFLEHSAAGFSGDVVDDQHGGVGIDLFLVRNGDDFSLGGEQGVFGGV